MKALIGTGGGGTGGFCVFLFFVFGLGSVFLDLILQFPEDKCDKSNTFFLYKITFTNSILSYLAKYWQINDCHGILMNLIINDIKNKKWRQKLLLWLSRKLPM